MGCEQLSGCAVVTCEGGMDVVAPRQVAKCLDLLVAAELDIYGLSVSLPVGLCLSRFLVRASSSSTSEFVKGEYLLNKNIVHLIDDIFWNMPFKPLERRAGGAGRIG